MRTIDVPLPLVLDGKPSALRVTPPSTRNELWETIRLLTGIKVPRTKVCKDHCSPFDALADAYFAKDSMAVWMGSRGLSGKSFTLALLGHLESLFLAVDIAILGGSGQQAKNVHKYQSQFWAYKTAPTRLLARAPLESSTKFLDGNEVQVLLASQTSVRSPHPVRLRLDEVDEMDLSLFDAATGQTMSKGGIAAQTVMSSTFQYPNGTFAEVLRRARDRGWPIYTWCYRETLEPMGWLAPSEVIRKKREVSDAVWRIEYELGEPSIGDRAFDEAAVELVFDESLGQYVGDNGEYIEVEEPDVLGVYVTGADWARKTDWSTFTTYRVDCSPARLVAFERIGRMAWSHMIGRFVYQMKRYNSHGNHDATGLGDVVADGVISQLAEVGIRETYEGERLTNTIMVGQRRSSLLSSYCVAIENCEMVGPRIEWQYRQHLYATREDLYSASSNHHLPDSISSAALAWMVRDIALQSRVAVGEGMVFGVASSKWR